jgi:hypothetical protein
MRPHSVLFALSLLATLAAVACSNDDDGSPGPTAGSSGKGNAGSSGKGNAGSSGKGNAGSAGKGSDGKAGSENNGGESAGGSAGVDNGAAGDTGQPMGCVHLSDFVHSIIQDDTNAKSTPRPVNDVVFCDDIADPAAYSDLF